MNRKPTIHPGVLIKNLARFALHPRTGAKLAALQCEKWAFNLLYPHAGRLGKARKIRQLSLRITDMCNLRCLTCGQWGEAGYLHQADLKDCVSRQVKPARYAELFEDLKANGHQPLVYLWGGEPMLYEGYMDVIDSAVQHGMPVSIATNGYRVAREAERLVKAPLYLFQISVDGHCAALHDRIRPDSGSRSNYADVMEGLDAINAAKQAHGTRLPLVASLTTISRENAGHLVDIYTTLREKVDMCIFYYAWWIDEQHARMHEDDFQRRFGFSPARHRGWIGSWIPDDFVELARQISELERMSVAWSAPPVMLIPHITGEENIRRYYTDHACRFGYDQCISIYQAVEINSNGDMAPCRDYNDYVVGNIKEQTISELWNSDAYRRFRQSLAKDGLMPVCSRCCGLMAF